MAISRVLTASLSTEREREMVAKGWNGSVEATKLQVSHEGSLGGQDPRQGNSIFGIKWGLETDSGSKG